MRFSLKWLLIAVAFVAVSLVALLNANTEWLHGSENVVLLLILTGVAGIVCLKGEPRMFSFGFVLFGMTYFVLSTGLFGFNRSRYLLPTYAFEYVHKQMFTPTREVVHVSGSMVEGDIIDQQGLANGMVRILVVRPSEERFKRVGNALLCVPLGLVGGLIARRFYRRSRNERDLLNEVKQ